MTTVNYSWTLPTVGASTNTWGTLLNTILTDIDSKMVTATHIVAERSATATLTSKTLTNPVINGFSGTGNGSVTGTLTSAGFNSSGTTGFVGTSGGSDLYFWDINQFAPNTNGTRALGTTSLRWSQVWCTAGAFNTSDARLKTPVSKFNNAEIQAAIALSKEIGWFQWLDSVQQKGPIKARHHVGLTVQRAEEVLASFGLDPWLYGFMSHDKWDDQITEHPAIEAKEAVLDEAGNVIEEAIEASEAWSEVTLKAGESYAFRYDQLNLFIARGIEARLVALEANA